MVQTDAVAKLTRSGGIGEVVTHVRDGSEIRWTTTDLSPDEYDALIIFDCNLADEHGLGLHGLVEMVDNIGETGLSDTPYLLEVRGVGSVNSGTNEGNTAAGVLIEE